MAHGRNHIVHQFGAIVEHLQDHILGQYFLNLRQFRLQPARHNGTILPHQHEAQTQHNLPFARTGNGAAPDLMIHLDGGHIPDPHGNAIVGGDDDARDLLDVGGEPQPMHQQRFPAPHHLPAAHVLVVRLKGLEQLFKRETVFDKPLRLGDDMILLLESPPGVDLRHPAHLPQLRLDHPVLHFTQFGEGPVGVNGADHIVEHLPQPGGYGAELGPGNPGGQFHGLQALCDELPRPEDACGIIIGGHHLREAKLGYRPDIHKARQPANGQFHRDGDLRLGLLRVQGGHGGIDLHLDRRRVRKGVHRQICEGTSAHQHQQHRHNGDGHPVLERSCYDPVQHGLLWEKWVGPGFMASCFGRFKNGFGFFGSVIRATRPQP